jgi:DNA-binding transcriptional MocR family regulator
MDIFTRNGPDCMDWLPTISDGAGPKYRQITQAIETDIASGLLRRGQQMPTHRELAIALGIDLTTVTRAYSDARHRGLLDARTGRGTFVSETTARAAVDMPESVSIDLSMNVPPQPLEAALDARIERALGAIHKREGISSHLNYQEPGGSEQDRAMAATWLRPRLGETGTERVVIYPGSQAAIFNILLTHLKPGETVLTEALTFPGFRAAAEKLGVRLIGVAMDAQGVVPDALFKAIRLQKPKAVYLTPTMHNPTTATMGKARRKEIAEVLRKARVMLIEDDAYGALDPLQQPLAALLPEQTFLTVSLSKCLAPALRVSFLVAPDRAAAQLLRRSLRATSQMAPPLMSALVIEWLRTGEAERIIAAIRNEASGRQQLAARMLKEVTYAAHAKGHHLWLPLPDRWNRTDFVAELLRQGLAVVGSEAFAVETSPPHAVRLCLGAARNRAELSTALQLLVGTLRRAAMPSQVV